MYFIPNLSTFPNKYLVKSGSEVAFAQKIAKYVKTKNHVDVKPKSAPRVSLVNVNIPPIFAKRFIKKW